MHDMSVAHTTEVRQTSFLMVQAAWRGCEETRIRVRHRCIAVMVGGTVGTRLRRPQHGVAANYCAPPGGRRVTLVSEAMPAQASAVICSGISDGAARDIEPELRSRGSGRSWTQARHASGGRAGGIGPNMSSKRLLGHVGRGGRSRRGPHEQNWLEFECQDFSSHSTQHSAQCLMLQAAPHS
ncbi:hypothetical protein HaLaN_01719 [Haematococcus lacustris]|uniref:Uncharacterized protein n=1 Tax=Haematococcus lacustris TaxID=44745 RepID=A0A699YGG8_HAELA|nr:hypothetical protein HaLaN_01719 [Haematococcus lacustris]